ncbi:hypothetical protein BaRGS_00002086 [Batillaria attramentaria]|uniref:Uncharacterized protein n=1 Tax=Batillaria attramentaria TaxID=370345 RepID=A0ABD0M5G5_9CAEN
MASTPSGHPSKTPFPTLLERPLLPSSHVLRFGADVERQERPVGFAELLLDVRDPGGGVVVGSQVATHAYLLGLRHARVVVARGGMSWRLFSTALADLLREPPKHRYPSGSTQRK